MYLSECLSFKNKFFHVMKTTLAYIWTAIKHSPAEWTMVLETDNRIVSFIKYFFKILSKIFWPITYISREYTAKVYIEGS